MSEMVERVARAIWDAERALPDNEHRPDWRGLNGIAANAYRSLAHAAIAAMREPTEEMTEQYKNNSYDDIGDYAAARRQMLLNALKWAVLMPFAVLATAAFAAMCFSFGYGIASLLIDDVLIKVGAGIVTFMMGFGALCGGIHTAPAEDVRRER